MSESLKLTNPFDPVGQLHNQGVDFVISCLAENKIKTDRVEQIVEATAKYMQSIILGSNQANSPTLTSKTHYPICFSFLANNNNRLMRYSIEKILKESKIGESMCLTINNIFEIPDELNIDSRVMILNQYEKSIFEMDISENQKKYALLTIAVSKASLAYKQDVDLGVGENENERHNRILNFIREDKRYRYVILAKPVADINPPNVIRNSPTITTFLEESKQDSPNQKEQKNKIPKDSLKMLNEALRQIEDQSQSKPESEGNPIKLSANNLKESEVEKAFPTFNQDLAMHLIGPSKQIIPYPIKWFWKSSLEGAVAGFIEGEKSMLLTGYNGNIETAILGAVGGGIAESVIRLFSELDNV